MKSKAISISLVFYTLLAFVLSAWILKHGYFIGYDGVYYARVGENIFSGKGVSSNPGEAYVRKPSFYPFLLGAANLIFKDPEFSGHFVAVWAFALTVIPLFFITRQVYSENAAHWASLLYLSNGYLHLHANAVMTESLFTLLVLTLFLLIQRTFQDKKGKEAFLGISIGMVSGIAFLTRLEGVLFYGVGVLAIFLLSQKPPASKSKMALFSLAVFLAFFIPYVNFIHQHTRQFQLGNAMVEAVIRRQMDVAHPGQDVKVKRIYQGLTSDKSRIKINELVEEFHLLDYLRKDRYALLRSLLPSMAWRLLGLSKYLFGGLGFFFIGASFVSGPWDSQRKKSELLFLLFLSTFGVQLFGEFIPKRYFFYFPFFLIWMGNGIEQLRKWALASFHLSQKTSFAVAISACLFFVVPSGWYVARTLTTTPVPLEYKEMGLWMKKNLPGIEKEPVAATHPSVNFYSGSKLLNPPHLPYVEKFEDFLTYMAHQKTKYFVVSDDLETSVLTESYRFLLDDTLPPPSGILRLHTVANEGKKIILYQILSR